MRARLILSFVLFVVVLGTSFYIKTLKSTLNKARDEISQKKGEISALKGEIYELNLVNEALNLEFSKTLDVLEAQDKKTYALSQSINKAKREIRDEKSSISPALMGSYEFIIDRLCEKRDSPKMPQNPSKPTSSP